MFQISILKLKQLIHYFILHLPVFSSVSLGDYRLAAAKAFKTDTLPVCSFSIRYFRTLKARSSD